MFESHWAHHFLSGRSVLRENTYLPDEADQPLIDSIDLHSAARTLQDPADKTVLLTRKHEDVRFLKACRIG